MSSAPKWLQLLGSRFACFFLFQITKNRTQRNRRPIGCEVRIRTVAKKFSIGGHYICAGDLTLWRFDEISTDLWCFIWGAEWLDGLRTTNQNLIKSLLIYISIWEAEWLDGLRTNNLRHKTQTRFCILFLFSYFLSLCGRVLWLPVGKVTFACYSRSSRSLIFLPWEQYQLAQVLNSNLISEWLS